MASKTDFNKIKPHSELGEGILNHLSAVKNGQSNDSLLCRVVIGGHIRRFQRFKVKGIIENESSEEDDENSYMSDESDMAIDTKNKHKSDYLSKAIVLPGIKISFDKEVLELLAERQNIKLMEIDIRKKMEEEEKAKAENQSIDDMYSDIEDDNLDPLKNAYAQQNKTLGIFEELLGPHDKLQNATTHYNQQISDLVKAIEDRREKEKEDKKNHDIKPASVDDYFKGFSSTITKKIKNEKQIRSVLQETIDSGKQLTEEQELAEIQRRLTANNSDYMECFPMEHDNIKGFDESDFAEKVKQKYYDEDVIKKDNEWMSSERKTFKFNSKHKEEATKKRDNKYKRKVEKDTDQINNYMSSK